MLVMLSSSTVCPAPTLGLAPSTPPEPDSGQVGSRGRFCPAIVKDVLSAEYEALNCALLETTSGCEPPLLKPT